jgi:hypothetical protein
VKHVCKGCGQTLPGGAAFCSACEERVIHGELPLCWSVEFQLVTSPFFLGDAARFLLLTYLLLITISFLMNLAAANELSNFLPFLALWAVAVAGLGVFGLLVAGLMLGNRGGAIYLLDEQGVSMLSRSKATPLNEISQWLGILTGNAQLWATGLLAKAEEKVAMSWPEVHKVRYFPDHGVVELYDSFHMAMRIYCPSELYPVLTGHLQALVPAPVPGRARMRIWGWLGLCLLGTLCGLCWEPTVNDVGFLVVLTAMFAFIAGLLPGMMHRGLGLFGLFSGVVALGHRLFHLGQASDAGEAGLASFGCALLVGLCFFQVFRRERPGREMVLVAND